MRSRASLLYTLVHREFYETITQYKPLPEDYIYPVKELLGPEWALSRNTVWLHCRPAVDKVPAQGWKIHISGTIQNAKEILTAVVPVLRRTGTSFKFALDHRMLLLLNSKNWSRGGSGKFITIYPHSDADFYSLLQELDAATREFDGPYILSDRRYKDSKVVHYRYGGMQLHEQHDVKGEKTPVINTPDGETIPDRRTPFFSLPGWVTDPLQPEEPEDAGALKDGRYEVQRALSFTNSGGVYVALDHQTGAEVIIKEARPLVSFTYLGNDAVHLLQKEHRLLQKLEGSGIAPRVVDFFQDWEHHFLVEEYIKGTSLRNFSTLHNVLLKTRYTREQIDTFYQEFKTIFASLAQSITVLHEHGIVFCDLSPNNIIVDPETLQCYIIDFEAACEPGIDKPTYMFTPGYGNSGDIAENKLRFETDYFALGAMMLSYMLPINTIFDLKPEAAGELLNSIAADFGVPPEIHQVILRLMDKNQENRPHPSEVYNVLSGDISPAQAAAQEHITDTVLEHLEKEIAKYALTLADPRRTDRLFPADPKVFSTNPLSLAHGACGTAVAIHYSGVSIPEHIMNWILERDVDKRTCPPGLYLGMSGIAWCLWKLGLRDKAQEIFSRTFDHPLLYAGSDIFYGLAGWGIAALKFFQETQDELYLSKAREAGDRLCQTAQKENASQYYWSSSGEVPLGFAHGASGISLFLLYLYLATGVERYLSTAERGLAFDLAHGVETMDGGLSWPYNTQSSAIILPYWRYGSAGVGSSVLRFYKVLGYEHYRSALEKVFIDTQRKYSVTPNRFTGLTGIGEFLLDAHDLLQDSLCLESARKIADGLTLFALHREQGATFPGDGLHRISCDYGTGAAGISLFFHRLRTGHGFNTLPDSLLSHKRQEPASTSRLALAA